MAGSDYGGYSWAPPLHTPAVRAEGQPGVASES